MTNVEKLCAEVIDASENAFGLPWKVDTCNVGETCWCRLAIPIFEDRIHTKDYIIGDGACGKHDVAFIVLAANNAPKLARALIIAKKALDKIGASCGEVDSTEACWFVLAVHKQALADIDEILK